MTAAPAPGRTKRWFLRAGVGVGALMVVVPFITSLAGIGMASGVQGGLRGATHRPEKAEEVGVAFATTSLLGILAPPGILLAVMCGLGLVERKPRAGTGRKDAAPGSPGPEHGEAGA